MNYAEIAARLGVDILDYEDETADSHCWVMYYSDGTARRSPYRADLIRNLGGTKVTAASADPSLWWQDCPLELVKEG